MIFDRTATAYDFLAGTPKFAPILHTVATGDPARRMASLNAGDPGLYVGGGTINLQFSHEIPEPGRYRAIHQTALDLARAGIFVSDVFDASDPVRFVLTTLDPGDAGAGPPEAGTVFLDVFNAGQQPHGVPENFALCYLIPPNGAVGFADDESFLAAVTQSAKNVVRTVNQFNAGIAAEAFTTVPDLVPITDLRTCLFSGGAFRSQTVSPQQVAGAIFGGFLAEISNGDTDLKLVEFANGQGEFDSLRG